MRFWPRRRAAPVPPPSDDAILMGDVLRRNVDDILAVYDNSVRNGVFLFRGQLITTPARALETLRERFARFGYTPYLRAHHGGVLVQAWPTPAGKDHSRVAVNVVLFVLTLFSTLLAGAWWYAGSPTFDAFRHEPGWWWLLSGVPFAATLLLTLGVHEFGHYFTARHYGVSVSLPYFIPLPPIFPTGTLGAVIRMRSPARDRNALFDIAAAGPIAGLVIALPALVLGITWSSVVPAPAGAWIFGDSLLTRLFVSLHFGAIPDGMRIYTHPVFDAAWFGLLVTALNLMPVGQLDGGRIAYALFGTRHRMVGIATFVALLALGVVTWSANWVVWGLFVLVFVGFHHGPPLDDVTPLTPGRRALGFACLALLVLLVPPVPIEIP
jgi:membrane-associated protease RseP (regulator of RpoE activity)